MCEWMDDGEKLKGICHFKQIALERIKLSFSPHLVLTVRMDRKKNARPEVGVLLLTCKNLREDLTACGPQFLH